MWPRFLIWVLKAVIVWTLYERKSREKCKYGFLLVETYCRQTRQGRGEDAGLRAALWQNRVRRDPNSGQLASRLSPTPAAEPILPATGAHCLLGERTRSSSRVLVVEAKGQEYCEKSEISSRPVVWGPADSVAIFYR